MTLRLDEITVGMGVVYEPYPGAPLEDGVVTEIRPSGVMVRYSALGPAKLTPLDRLTALGSRGGAE